MAKGNDFKRGIRIYLETSDYGKGIEEMAKKTKEYENKLADLVKKSDELTAAGKNTGAEWKKLQSQIEKKKKQVQQSTTAEAKYKKQLDETEAVLKNLSGATYTQLLKVRKQLRQEMQNTERDSKKYIAAQKQLERVDKEVSKAQADLNTQIGCQGTVMGKTAGFVNKYMALFTGFIASITGLSMTFRKLAQDVAAMDDVYADVMKTTNMTRNEVLELNDVFKQMDTRTAREELNMLARDAGKLGLTGRKDILDFVEAGNQIRVALGDDLGDDAIKSIGKMVGVYANASEQIRNQDLKGQMLGVASAVNELGMSSTANEKYLVAFAGRLGGVAKQAKINIADILGYGSALDQDMQAVEMSATALQKFIMKIMGEPAKYAKIAKMEVGEFSRLLQTDANTAIKTVLRALNEKGGFQDLIPMFKDMGLDGARAVGVLSSMAGSIEKVEDAQRIANKALAEGVSVTQEYDIKNNNLQAQLEKARKRFKDVSLELGESLNPMLLKSTKGTTYLIKALVELPKWLKENKTLIIALVSAYGLYALAVANLRKEKIKLAVTTQKNLIISKAITAATQLQIAVTGYLTGATRTANLAMKAFFKTLSLNPYIAIGVAIGAVVVGLYKLITANKKLSAEQQLLNSTTNAVSSELARETINLEAYRKRLVETEPNSRARVDLVKKLTELYPDLLAGIDAENASVDVLNARIKEYSKNLEQTIRLKVLYNQISEKIAELETAEDYGTRTRLKNEIALLKERYEYQHLVVEYGEENAKLLSRRGELETKLSNLQIVNRNLSYESFREMWKAGNEQKRILFMTAQAEEDALNKAYNDYKNQQLQVQADIKSTEGDLKKIQDILAKKGNKDKDKDKDKDKNKDGGGEEDELSKQQQKAINSLLKNTQTLLAIEAEAHKKRLKANNLFEVDMTKLSEEQLEKRLELEELYYTNLDRIAREAEKERYKQAKAQIGVSTDAAPEKSGLSGDRLKAYEILYSQHQANLAKIDEDGIKRRDDFTKNNDNIRLKALADARDAMLKAEEGTQAALLVSLQQGVIDRTITQEDYNDRAAELEASGMENRLEILSSYRDMLLDIEGELTEAQIKAIEDANKAVAAAEKAINDKKLADEFKYQNDRKSLMQQYGLQSIAETQRLELEALKTAYDKKLLEEKEYQKARIAIRMQYAQEYIQQAQTLTSAGADMVSAIEQAQTAKIGAEYTKRLSALTEQYNQGIFSQEDYNAQKEQLDYEQRVAELETQKKYADANFALQVAQIGASTALASMQAYSALAGIPVVGPALGAAAAIAAGIAGAAQIAAAKAERDRVKALTIEKPSSSSSGNTASTGARVAITTDQAADGRYDVIGEDDGKTYRNVPYKGVMRTGMVSSPTLVAEQGNEVVIDHPTLRNLQMNAPHVIDTIMRYRVPQRAEGKYLTPGPSPQGEGGERGVDEDLIRELIETLGSLQAVLQWMRDNGIDAKVYLNELEAKQRLRDKSVAKGSLK